MSPLRQVRAQREENRGGRPKGEARQALADAAAWWVQQRQAAPLTALDGRLLAGGTGLELMQRARVGRHVSAQTLKNMVRAGDLLKLGRVEVAGQRRPLTVYAPGARAAGQADAPRFGDLVQAVGAMARVG